MEVALMPSINYAGCTYNRFVALKDLDDDTYDAVTWSRHPVTEPPKGKFGLMFVPSFPDFVGDFVSVPDPHKAFFTLMRTVYGNEYNPKHGILRGTGFSLGSNTVIENVAIGNNVTIGNNCSIGGAGFGPVFEADGSSWIVPHIGRVIIEDGVYIGNNVCIDRGCLGDTIIRKGARIDNLVHVAHNVDVGENVCIVAQALICGSVRIGARTWVGGNACIKDGVTVGSDVIIGLCANVVKDVPDGITVVGNPAKSLVKSR